MLCMWDKKALRIIQFNWYSLNRKTSTDMIEFEWGAEENIWSELFANPSACTQFRFWRCSEFVLLPHSMQIKHSSDCLCDTPLEFVICVATMTGEFAAKSQLSYFRYFLLFSCWMEMTLLNGTDCFRIAVLVLRRNRNRIAWSHARKKQTRWKKNSHHKLSINS